MSSDFAAITAFLNPCRDPRVLMTASLHLFPEHRHHPVCRNLCASHGEPEGFRKWGQALDNLYGHLLSAVVNEQNNPCFATLIRIPFLSEGALRKAEGRAAAIGSLPMFRRILGKIWGVVPSEEQVLVEGLRLYAPKAEEGSPFSPPSDRPLLRALSTLSLLPEAIAEQCFRHAVLDPIEPLRSFLSTDYLLGLLPLVPAAYRDEVEEYLS